ncbi:hypothetical protein [Prosthecobacter sp.]|uniref:hypothetical protein n=1 Tax=Prosthecobacter sp. TaxID=1965333 RepID=UPI0037850AC6
MNCQERQSPLKEGLGKHSGRRTPPPPPAFQLLNWMHVINEPDPETQELDFEQALSRAAEENALLRPAE